LLPFVFLFGGIGAFVGLNRKSELVAMRAAGISAWRFILPSAFAAFVLGALAVTVLNPLSAALAARFEVDRARMMENYLGDLPRDVWLRQGDERTQMVIHAKARDTVAGAVRLRGVSLYIYQKNKAGQPEFIAFWKLPAAIRATEQAGFSAAGYRLRFQQLLATPLLFAAMSILAAAFSLRLARLGGLAGLAGAGVSLGFVVFFFNQFSGALGRADIIPLFAAAWAPAVVALLSGLTLLCYTEDG